jgi:hypothetical protein
MKSIASLVLALLALAGAAGAAHASSYALFGLGPQAGVGGDLGDHADGDSRTLRFGFGQRVGPVALEGSVFGADLLGTGGAGFADGREYWTLSLGLDVKAFFTLVGPIELFPKIGLNQTWVQGNEMDGTGWDAGFGAQFVLDMPLGYAAVWADFTHQRLGLSDDLRDVDGTINMIMVGASLGL